MIDVTVEYRPFGFLWTRRLETTLPARWSEMNADQLVAVPGLQRGTIDESKLLQIFLGLKQSVAKRVDSYQKYCILRNLKFITEPGPMSMFVVKKIVGFKAPADKLKDITFGSFIFGDTYFQNYISGKQEDLNKFIACFYYNRFGFQEKNIEAHARIIGLVDIKIREAIAINYGLIREWLALSYPYAFQRLEEEKKHEKSAGWVSVFDNIVGDDIVNSERYAEKPLSEMLRHLNRKIKEYYKNGSKVQRPG